MTRHSGRRPPGTPRPLRIALPIVATVAIVAPLAWLWQDSWVPAVYSVMDMGHPDYGAGAVPDTRAAAGMAATCRARCPTTTCRRRGWSPI